jgi:hypothetical protein
MWSSFHASVGAAIVLATPDPVVGLGLAFLSHFVVDYIGETGYKSLKEAAFAEGNLLAIYITAASLGDFWLLMGAWVMANLPDLIDKPRRLIWGKEEWFSCHNGKGLFQAFGKKLGYPVLCRLTYTQTVVLNIVSTLIFVAIMVATHYLNQ